MADGERDRPLDSWKHICLYLGINERTGRRWQKECGLPVHRPPGGGRRAVFAYRSEIDQWLHCQGSRPEPGFVVGLKPVLQGDGTRFAPAAQPEPAQAPSSAEAPAPSLGRGPTFSTAVSANSSDYTPSVRLKVLSASWLRWGALAFLAAAGAALILILITRGRAKVAPSVRAAKTRNTPASHRLVASGSPWNPEVLFVRFHGEPGDLGIELAGLGFGQVTMRLPFAGDVRWFHIGDVSCYGETPGRCEAGYTGDVYAVTYRSWSDNRIVISHYAEAAPGDALELVVWNPQSRNRQDAAVWGGNVPPVRPGTLQVSKVTFGGAGKGLEITIEGSNFGKAPPGLPGTGSTAYLEIGDFAFHSPRVPFSTFFRAGYANRNIVDAITLVFDSWADNRIVIGGFAGAYGQNGMVVRSGDPISIDLWNTKNHLATAWGGRVP